MRYVVEGAVRVANERTDVKAWLTEASTGTEVWSENLQLNKTSDANDRQVRRRCGSIRRCRRR